MAAKKPWRACARLGGPAAGHFRSPMKQPPQPSFDEGLDRLEALVQQLEAGSLPLEAALARFEEGVRLSQALQQQLAEAQRKVELLKAGLGGEYRADPLDPDKGGP